MNKTEKEMYRIMWVSPQGYADVNSDGYETEKEACDNIDYLLENFPDEEYYIEPYIHVERTYGYRNSVDGWEDIYTQ